MWMEDVQMRQLHALLSEMRITLTARQWVDLHGRCGGAPFPSSSSASPSSLEAALMDVMRLTPGRFRLSVTLFWLQNQMCFSRVRLEHIVASREWSKRFVALSQLTTQPLERARWRIENRMAQLLQLRGWFDHARDFGDPPPVPPPFALNFEPGRAPPPPTSEQIVLHLVREATHNDAVAMKDIQPSLDALADRDRYFRRQHALVTLARWIATAILLPGAATRAQHAHLQRVRIDTYAWLNNYRKWGCACDRIA